MKACEITKLPAELKIGNLQYRNKIIDITVVLFWYGRSTDIGITSLTPGLDLFSA